MDGQARGKALRDVERVFGSLDDEISPRHLPISQESFPPVGADKLDGLNLSVLAPYRNHQPAVPGQPEAVHRLDVLAGQVLVLMAGRASLVDALRFVPALGMASGFLGLSGGPVTLYAGFQVGPFLGGQARPIRGGPGSLVARPEVFVVSACRMVGMVGV